MEYDLTLRINFFGHFESIGVGQIHVGWSHGKNQAALPADELQNHIFDLILNVLWLVTHWHLGDTRKVNQSQIQHCKENGPLQTGFPVLSQD